jgi:DNA-binding response OmpR family regulator
MPHILVIEDDPDILEILRLELEDQPGNTVETSHTAEEALIEIGRDQYDVIVTDLRMPGICGDSLIRLLLEQGCQA